MAIDISQWEHFSSQICYLFYDFYKTSWIIIKFGYQLHPLIKITCQWRNQKLYFRSDRSEYCQEFWNFRLSFDTFHMFYLDYLVKLPTCFFYFFMFLKINRFKSSICADESFLIVPNCIGFIFLFNFICIHYT